MYLSIEQLIRLAIYLCLSYLMYLHCHSHVSTILNNKVDDHYLPDDNGDDDDNDDDNDDCGNDDGSDDDDDDDLVDLNMDIPKPRMKQYYLEDENIKVWKVSFSGEGLKK